MKPYLLAFFAALSSFSALFAQIDTTPPVLHCRDFLSVTFPGGCNGIDLFAADFITDVTDNQPANFNLEYGIRKTCTGTGFPVGAAKVYFNGASVGMYPLEIWVKDHAGNSSTCTSNVIISPGLSGCDPATFFWARTPAQVGIAKTYFSLITDNSCNGDHYESHIKTNSDGFTEINGLIGGNGYTWQVIPYKDSVAYNGISGIDLLLISKYILGLQTLSPIQLLAADANLDGKVTTADIILLRQMVLGVITEFPHHRSWRFVPADYVFPDPANPFMPMPPDRVLIPNTLDLPHGTFEFIGIKIGDVNMSANPGL